ncbi:discoidin domain-containing protein [Streptomyces sp. NRRL S-1314]|uniref:discoidin domain-containing protein n=1 Tax=Streptomyces sp. NRRL S-1314 TaxID=1463882 RepID=UPI0004CB6A0B|nr:discoidin domain-containing protein [Streptomyces sp. NRRL S-1314]
MGFEATYADFSADPARLANADVRLHGARFAGSHLALSAGGTVTLRFEVADPEDVPQVTLTVTALVSKAGGSLGYAPMDVFVQGEPVAENLTVPGGGDLPQDNVFAVPGHLLKPGVNTLEIRSSAEARTMLWLYRVTLDPVWERGRSERARTAAAARDSVFAYRTEVRPAHSSSAHWQPAPRLLFHVDRGEHALPAQLGWRGTDGAETAISFQSNMSDFHGCRRDADGVVHEYRGRVAGRWTYPEGADQVPAESLHRFHTEEGWGGGWHRSHELRLLVDDGGAAPERITWRDQRGNSGVVVLHTLEEEAEVTDVEASDEYAEAGEIAHNLLDDSRDKWLAGEDTALLDFTLARPAAVTSYVLVSANDFPDRDPQDWTLHGSDDGHTWTPLDSRTAETFDRRYQAREFTLRGTPRAHLHLRLEITRNGGAHEIQLAQVRFLERPVGQGFTGYYQRHDEGPIGYRGTPVAASPLTDLPVAASRVASDLETAATSLAETARTLAALAAQLRTR